MGKGISKIWGKEWTSPAGLERHFNDHGKKMGYTDSQKYLSGAKNFINGNKPGTQSFISSDGKTYMYNPSTNQFAIVSPSGRIITYYLPDKRMVYWLRELDKHGIDY